MAPAALALTARRPAPGALTAILLFDFPPGGWSIGQRNDQPRRTSVFGLLFRYARDSADCRVFRLALGAVARREAAAASSSVLISAAILLAPYWRHWRAQLLADRLQAGKCSSCARFARAFQRSTGSGLVNTLSVKNPWRADQTLFFCHLPE